MLSNNNSIPTSEELVGSALTAIDRQAHLHAFITTTPPEIALKRAKMLDKERQDNGVRSPLHGMPIAIKDAMVTAKEHGLTSTVGAEAFNQMTCTRDSKVMDRLMNAGMVIVGKTNLTELCGLKDVNTPIGYSIVGGQVLSPYRTIDLAEKDQPIAGGSSAGSAVSIASGMVSLAVGTETAGSNVWPASLNGVYGLTLSHGSVPTAGIFRISETFDRVGVMAADIPSLSALAGILQSRTLIEVTAPVRIGVAACDWGIDEESSGMRKWTLEETINQYERQVESLRLRCQGVIYPLSMPDPTALVYKGQSLHTTALFEHSEVLDEFLTNYEPFEGITDLASLIDWNRTHSEIAMPDHHPGQSMLEDAQNTTMDSQLHDETLDHIRKVAGPEGLDKVMGEQSLDVIVTNSDSMIVAYAAWLGWPVGTFPVGRLKRNGQPWGMFVVARQGREDLLLRVMSLASG